MYNPGSIADRLRETQRQADTAYARLNFVNVLLGEAYDKIHKLEKENASLKEQLNSSIISPQTKIPLIPESSNESTSDISDNTESDTSDISDLTKGEIENDTGRTKKAKRNSA
jgi:hypothetical protein